jgi:hypothetical protein
MERVLRFRNAANRDLEDFEHRRKLRIADREGGVNVKGAAQNFSQFFSDFSSDFTMSPSLRTRPYSA